MFDKQTQAFLKGAVIPVRVACLTAQGWPLVVSLWFLAREGSIYCATQADSRLVRHLENDARCGYEVASDQPPYCGVRGRARATIDSQSGGEILESLLLRYLGNTDNPLALRLLKKRQSEVTLRLTPQTVYAWNFSSRMTDSIPGLPPKPCP